MIQHVWFLANQSKSENQQPKVTPANITILIGWLRFKGQGQFSMNVLRALKVLSYLAPGVISSSPFNFIIISYQKVLEGLSSVGFCGTLMCPMSFDSNKSGTGKSCCVYYKQLYDLLSSPNLICKTQLAIHKSLLITIRCHLTCK